jgi:hypothetical protein
MKERRSFAFLETIAHDLSYGARSLARRPGFTIAASLSLALGIGMTTAIFTVLNAVALRPLPYTDAGRLLWMTTILKKNSTDEVTLTAHFLEWRRQNHTFTDLAGFNYQTRNLTGLDEPRELSTAKVSESLLPLLGVQPVLGRNFLKREDYKGRDQVALLGNQLWRQQFGGAADILGKPITLDGIPFTVVGILPDDFVFPGPDQVQLLTPLGKDEAAELQFKVGSIVRNIVGRLKPGATLQEARADMEVITSRLPLPPWRPTITLKMLPIRTYLFGNVKTASLVLVAAAGFLLLIACANVSNLLLARWMQRDREMSIRSGRFARASRFSAPHRKRPARGPCLRRRSRYRFLGTPSASRTESRPRLQLEKHTIRWTRPRLCNCVRHPHDVALRTPPGLSRHQRPPCPKHKRRARLPARSFLNRRVGDRDHAGALHRHWPDAAKLLENALYQSRFSAGPLDSRDSESFRPFVSR